MKITTENRKYRKEQAARAAKRAAWTAKDLRFIAVSAALEAIYDAQYEDPYIVDRRAAEICELECEKLSLQEWLEAPENDYV